MPTLLIIGHKGQLGRALTACPTALEPVGLDLPEFDMTNDGVVMDTLLTLRPPGPLAGDVILSAWPRRRRWA